MTSGPETSTELQRASPESKALVIGVERAYVALRDARNDFERLIVRDKAQAIAAAAEVLKRRDIQTEASILVASAEREIAKANPPIPPEQRSPGRGGNTVPWGNGIPQSTVRKIRQAHDKLTDEQFEAVAEEARAQGEPLTRTALKREARKLNPPAQDDSDESEPDKPKPPTKVELLEAERDGLALDVQDKATRIDELEDELQFHRGNLKEHEHERHKAFTDVQARLTTALSQINEWMTKANDEVQARKGMTYDRDRWRERAAHPCANCGTEGEWADG